MGMELSGLRKWLAKNAESLKSGAKECAEHVKSGASKAKRAAEDWLGRDYQTHGGFPDRGELVAPKMSKNGKATLAGLGAGAGAAGGAAAYFLGDDDEDDKPKKKKREYL